MTYTSFGGGGATTYANPNITYEPLGFAADGEGTVVTSGATTNTKGSYTEIGTTSAAWAGFVLHADAATAAASQFLADIEISGVGIIVPDIYVAPGNTQGAMLYRIPLQVPSGSLIRMRHQALSTSQTVNYAIEGILANGTSNPGFAACEAIIAADNTNTRPTTVDIPISNTWTQENAAVSRAYGAVLMNLGYNGSAPAATRKLSVALGVGAAASEVEIFRMSAHLHSSGTPFMRGAALVEKVIASGARVSAKAQNSAGAAENIRVQLLGFY